MLKVFVVTLWLLLAAQNGVESSGLRTLFEMQQRVWLSQSDITTLLLAAGTPKCLRHCNKGLVAATSSAFSFNGSLVDSMEKECKEYKIAKECVMKAKCGDASIFNIFTKGLEAACGENFHLIYFVKPCLDMHAEADLSKCDSECELTLNVEQLAENEQIKKMSEKGGNPIALLRHLGPTCSSLTCFLSCTHRTLNSHCPITGNAFVEVSLKPMEEVAEKLKTAKPQLKKMVQKKLPEECQPLLDIDYLNRLKAWGVLPDKKPANTP